MTDNDAAGAVIDALKALNIAYMVVGSFASNFYGTFRSTHDVDFVIDLADRSALALAERLGPEFRLDPQLSFESVTTTTRYTLVLIDTSFAVELFLLSDDAHDQERFRRRQERNYLGRRVYLLTAEDVIVTKLRWASHARREKDREDIRNVIAIQGERLDWNYIYQWAGIHGSRDLLDEIRRAIPGI